jgi:hypothetical protein
MVDFDYLPELPIFRYSSVAGGTLSVLDRFNGLLSRIVKRSYNQLGIVNDGLKEGVHALALRG